MVFAKFHIMIHGFVSLYSPDPKSNLLPQNSLKNRTQVPISTSPYVKKMDWVVWVWIGTIILLARRTLVVSANDHIA